MTSPRAPATFTVEGATGEAPSATVTEIRAALREAGHDRARGFVLCPPWCRACGAPVKARNH